MNDATKELEHAKIPTGNPMNLTCTVAQGMEDNAGPVYAIVINGSGTAQPPSAGSWQQINGFSPPNVTYLNTQTDGNNVDYSVPAGGIAIYVKTGP